MLAPQGWLIYIPCRQMPRVQSHSLISLRDLLENAEFDKKTGELVVTAEVAKTGAPVVKRFSDSADLRRFLRECGYSGRNDGVKHFGHRGRRRVRSQDVETALEQFGSVISFADIGERIAPPLYELPSDLPSDEARVALSDLNDELIKYLAKRPDLLHSLAPRKFEELVAELFRDLGYDVLLTPQSRDGGYDVRAVRKDAVGTMLYLVECKKFAATRPVGVDLVRKLHGVSIVERASCAVLATTSYFTKNAIELASQIEYQMSLRDYASLTEWLKRYPVGRRH